ncbi:hypothetical protein JOF29_004337 [Kribbella aluminosa]|uniref:Uncharacterized protein n=1 Tax=Kribbella aluminosa TaxID=416017 RepID=A0ABS4UNQ4_9ACTN|nr:hypothetical protein [Kribbella aluminosa]MBP2353254.1 hypothetical protein [Kribbella aluminosa]
MTAIDLELRDELLRMASADQDARQRLDGHPRLVHGVPEQDLTTAERQTLKHLQIVDAGNTARMKTIIVTYGWPGHALVGADAPTRPGCWSSTPTETQPSSASAVTC